MPKKPHILLLFSDHQDYYIGQAVFVDRYNATSVATWTMTGWSTSCWMCGTIRKS